jgi:hypothetical protein
MRKDRCTGVTNRRGIVLSRVLVSTRLSSLRCDDSGRTAPIYRHRYQQTKARIGKQRGAKVARSTGPPTLRRDLAHAQP